jgi:preprotein translocase subunit SecD
MLAVLGAVIVLLFLAIVGSNLPNPGKWSDNFKVLLGLDLTSGTTVILKAEPIHGSKVTAAQMAEAQQIMFNRVNGAGFTEASVVPQGTDVMQVSVPGKNSAQVLKLVSQTAELLFRQVQLYAPNTTVSTPTPAATPTPTPSGSPTPSTRATPTPTATATALGLPGAAGAGGTAEMARSARSLTTDAVTRADVAQPAVAKATPTPSATASPAASASPTPTPTSSGTHVSTTADAAGDASLVSAKNAKLFDKVNCADKDWQKQIGYTPAIWNDPNAQIVSCGLANGTSGPPYKFVLAPAKVLGKDIHSASASLQQNTSFWQVNLSFNPAGSTAFGNLTTQMYNTYGKSSSTSPLDDLAVVLDGKVISFPRIDGAIVGGDAQITGNFDQSSATSLANVLSYGALPLSFHQIDVETVTPQLGHDQLDAGLLAGALGLILVVCYLALYYRGLAIVAVSSLVIAGLLVWLSVIALGKYQHLALSLAGIAGLIVAIGITADSFVVFFERIRDEVREGGRSLRAAVEHGWTRARRTILVSDTVSFLAAALLYYFSIGDVRGFAFTLGLTTIIDIVVVFTFTKPMMTLLAQTKFFGGGHPLSGLDPKRLGARAPWRGGPRTPARPARPATRPAAAKEA